MGQYYALLWLIKRCHRALSGALRGYCPNGVSYKLADTTNATYDGGIDVPLDDFSDANIRRLFLTTKYFTKFNIKKRDAA